MDDRRAMLLLALVFTLVYAWFFQGGGWNQNSHLDTIRAIVEHGSMEITPYAENTGDVGVIDGRTYSNKPPGLAWWGVPLYFVVYNVERSAGVALDAPWTITANAHLLTFYTSGVPAVVLVLLLYLHFRREGATLGQALCLSGGFGAGSLLLPYSGILMSHALAACLMFWAWYLLVGGRDPAAGVLAGAAVLTELLAAPAVVIFVSYLLAKRRLRSIPLFLAGPAAMLCVLLASPALHAIQSSSFTTPGLLFGMLDWPQPIRLFWLTFHPFRGLFACCPIFLICLLSFRRFSAESWACAAVVSYFLLFNLSFNGWTGGWAVGPRYLIPALPFLYTFALPGFVRFPRVSGVLMVVSAVAMLCVSAVEVTIPGPDTGRPPSASPVAFAARQLAQGHVSIWSEALTGPSRRDPTPHRVWASYNVGELLGLRGVFSLIPVVVLLLAFAAIAARSLRTSAPT